MNIHDIHNKYRMWYTRMAAGISRSLMNTAQLVYLNQAHDDADTKFDFPGSDDELGFEEVKLEGDEDETFGYYHDNKLRVVTFPTI